MKTSAKSAFVVSAIAAAMIWAFSSLVTGKTEPWDAPGAYYLVALAVAGAISGAIVPGHLSRHYGGAIAGQAVYELLFLKMGALFVLGLVLLAAYSTIFLAAAALVARLRNRSRATPEGLQGAMSSGESPHAQGQEKR